MSRTIKTWRDPFDEGFALCRRKEIEIKPGLTVLVGCNGAGKSTMLNNIKNVLEKEDVPVFYYDNLKSGGSSSIEENLFHGNTELAALAWTSSEGENINLNLGTQASKWKNFIANGDNSKKRFLFEDDEEKNEKRKAMKDHKERWILLDAMDSGFSIDNIVEMKALFDLVIKDGERIGKDVYIIISSNEYELAADADCLDVTEGTYTRFKSYEEFKKFILHTREKKNKRYER